MDWSWVIIKKNGESMWKLLTVDHEMKVIFIALLLFSLKLFYSKLCNTQNQENQLVLFISEKLIKKVFLPFIGVVLINIDVWKGFITL